MIISGSGRPNSQSQRVAGIIAAGLMPRGVEVDRLSLADVRLPMWDEVTVGDDGWQAAHWTPLSQRLAGADAFVVVTPEWHGMYHRS